MTESTAALNETPDINILDSIISHLKNEDAAEIAALLPTLCVADIAGLLESLPPEYRKSLWAFVPQEIAGETLTYLGDEVRSSIIGGMEHSDMIAATESLDVEDLAYVIEDLPNDMSDAVLESLDQDRRERLQNTLAYAEDSAGRLMSEDVISVRDDVSMGVVFRYLRRLKPLPAHTDAIMVTDDYGLYLGKLMLSDAISEDNSTLVADIMQLETDRVRVNDSEHDVAVLFERRDLTSVAVVDEDNNLIGRITVDDVVDIIRAEADKALLASGGLVEESDLFAPVIPSAKRRAVWLGINLITVFLAASVIGQFEAVLDKFVALAVLLPIVASMGGIAGSQTLTLAIRGMALGQITLSNLHWLGRKEVAVGLLNGVVWSVVVAIATYVWFESFAIAIIIAIAMILNLVAASISGIMIPFILNRMGIDPALSGAVILTTVTDIIGFLSFLGLATIFLL